MKISKILAATGGVAALRPSDTSHYQPFEIPESWEWCRMEDIAYVAAGSTPSKEHFVDKGVPYIKMYNLRNQKIDFDFQPQYIDRETHEGKLARSMTQPGDILMNIVGPPLGKIAIIPESLPEANFNQAAVLIRPYCDKSIMSKYLQLYLAQMDEINSISTKGSAGQVNISLSQSQNMRVPLPPLNEQERIVLKLVEYDCILETVNSNIEATVNSINSAKSKILELAITGKLVPQNPDDEPASELLKRINPKAEIITDNEHYPQLPDNWCWVRIEDINQYQSKSINPALFPNEKFEVYSVPIFDSGEPEVVCGGEIGSTKQSVQPQDILLCKINPKINRVWSVRENCGLRQIASSEWIIIRNSDFYVPYMVYCLMSPYFRTILQSNVTGVGGSLTRAQPASVKKYLIPIPPAEEQKRIAHKINELFQILDSITNNL